MISCPSFSVYVLNCQLYPTREFDFGVQVFLMKYTQDSSSAREGIAQIQRYRKMPPEIQLSDDDLFSDVSQS